MMLSKNAGSLPDERAHAISTTATAAAARITSAYSAVVCPASVRARVRARTHRSATSERARTYQNSSIPVHPLSADRLDGGHEHRDHREEEERGEDEEHEGEQHLHGRRPGAFGRGGSARFANVGREAPHLLGERGAERLRTRERGRGPSEVRDREPFRDGGELVPPATAESGRAHPPLPLG